MAAQAALFPSQPGSFKIFYFKIWENRFSFVCIPFIFVSLLGIEKRFFFSHYPFSYPFRGIQESIKAAKGKEQLFQPLSLAAQGISGVKKYQPWHPYLYYLSSTLLKKKGYVYLFFKRVGY